MAKELSVRFLGTSVPYLEGMAIMREAMHNVDTIGPQLLLLEHADTITTTRQHGRTHLHVSEEMLRARGIELIETDRGGDITFHGKGQLVGYPVMRLGSTTPDVGAYVRALEDILITACTDLGVVGCHRVAGKTGVWVNNAKLVAVGIGLSKGVTRHGFALNITTDLERFTDCITPCGLTGFGVTSLGRCLGPLARQTPSMQEACEVITAQFAKHFDQLTACQNLKIEEYTL
jgi:lipoyl(octanoyl) transferase